MYIRLWSPTKWSNAYNKPELSIFSSLGTLKKIWSSATWRNVGITWLTSGSIYCSPSINLRIKKKRNSLGFLEKVRSWLIRSSVFLKMSSFSRILDCNSRISSSSSRISQKVRAWTLKEKYCHLHSSWAPIHLLFFLNKK